MLNILLGKTAVLDGDTIIDYKLFTNQECQGWTGLSEPTVRRRLNALRSAGIVDVKTYGNPNQWAIVKPESATMVDVGLPKPEDIGY